MDVFWVLLCCILFGLQTDRMHTSVYSPVRLRLLGVLISLVMRRQSGGYKWVSVSNLHTGVMVVHYMQSTAYPQ